MNIDEFAFFNQQLAAMLREGIPLEGGLKQLAEGMNRGPLRAQVEQLQTELARGTPLREAVERTSLPEFYRRLVVVGAQTNDLPGVLTLLADHYHRANALWNRLKGLMVYPFLVLLVSIALTLVLSLVFSHFLADMSQGLRPPVVTLVSMWVPPVVLTVLVGLGLAAGTVPSWRARLRWRLPAFREASLAQLASALALTLRRGTPLAEALALAETLESASPARHALAQWRQAVQEGKGKPAQWAVVSPFPPLFLWLIQKGGEDLAAGFEKASEIFSTRASYRIELALYGALPISILFLGQMVFWQVAPLFHALTALMDVLGNG